MMIAHKPKYWVVIPAAGVGQRMQSDCPKQYIEIHNKTILEHTISLFATHSLIETTVVVLHANDTQWPTIPMTHPEKIVTTLGGETRADSVMQGLLFLQSMAASHDWVLVHDAARPCLSSEVLDRLIKTLMDHPVGGLLALPITDTVKSVDAVHHVHDTIPRDGLWAAQTPQMFRYSVLFDAMQQALKTPREITDEASAIELTGKQAVVVEGDWRNIKITTPDDVLRAQNIIPRDTTAR